MRPGLVALSWLFLFVSHQLSGLLYQREQATAQDAHYVGIVLRKVGTDK
jgi:peptidoglycan biosynthesis protein MviN/MurJ (putative lipid II flippase)